MSAVTRKVTSQPPPISHRPLWTIDQTATFLNCSAWTVAEMARKKQLPSHKVGRLVRFIPSEIETFAERA